MFSLAARKNKPNQMKKALTLLFLGFSCSLLAQHSATVSTLFEKDFSKNVITLNFTLNDALSADELAAVEQWSADNTSLLELSINGTSFHFETSIERLERSYLLKPFAMMNLDKFIVSGKEMSLEEFFTTNNL